MADNKDIADLVMGLIRAYFDAHSTEDVRPGPLTRWVESERGIPVGTQLAGQVRDHLLALMDEGFIVRVPGQPLAFRRSDPPPERIRYRLVPVPQRYMVVLQEKRDGVWNTEVETPVTDEMEYEAAVAVFDALVKENEAKERGTPPC